jgi:hypothetical protein
MASGFTRLDERQTAPGKRMAGSKVFTELPKPSGKKGRLKKKGMQTASFAKGGAVRDYGK